jgi:hypothetical protein
VILELLRGEYVLPVGLLAGTFRLGVVEGEDHQFAVDRDRSFGGVVEVKPAAEAADGRLVGGRVHRIGPDRRHLGGFARAARRLIRGARG